MSNGDDVLDNWEEIDETELTNKIHKLEKECKTKDNTNTDDIKTYSSFISTEESEATSTVPATGKMKLLQRAAQTKVLPGGTVNQNATTAAMENIASPLDDMSSTFEPVLMVLHKDVDEYQSANYTQPTNTQTVKILRRPTQSNEPRNNGVRPKQPIKTLQQREQEYAEARLRILGSAKNPEDDASANGTQITSTPTNNSTATVKAVTATTPTIAPATTQSTITPSNTQSKSNSSAVKNQPQPQPQLQQQQQQHYAPIQNSYNNYYQQTQQQQQQLSHSLSMPTFGNNRFQFSTSGLLPTPPIAPVVASNLQPRHPFQQLQHFNQQQLPMQQQQQQQTWSPVVGGSVSSYTLQRQHQRQQQLQQQQQQQQQQSDVLRTPRGPDGSTGFQMRR